MKRSPLERAIGTGAFLKLRGITYQCSGLQLSHFAEAKAFIANLAPDPVKELAEDQTTFASFPPEVQKALAVRALELREVNRNTAAEHAHIWVNSEEGILFFFWCMVRDSHKEFATFQSVLEYFDPQSQAKKLSIPEAQLIKEKIDFLTLGSDVDLKKKETRTKRKKRGQ